MKMAAAKIARAKRRFSASITELIGSHRKSQCNLQDTDGMSSLHQAALMGNMQILKMLLDVGGDLNQPDAKGMTPLHYTSLHNTPDAVSLLLQRGAKVNIANNEGNTALHIACQQGQIDVITVLMYYRSDPTVRNKHGITPFDLACEYGRFKAVEILLDSGLCKKLLFTNEDYAKDTTRHTTPLHLAAKNGHNDVIRLLLEYGCDVNCKIRSGTALHEAAASCRVDTVKLLLNGGADSHSTNANGQTPLNVVKKTSNKTDPAPQTVKQLIQEAQKAIYTKAICDYCAQQEDELSFNYGDVIWVTDQRSEKRWKGIIFGPKYTSRDGYFPSSSVQLIDKKAGLTKLANQRQVKKVAVPSVPDISMNVKSDFNSSFLAPPPPSVISVVGPNGIGNSTTMLDATQNEILQDKESTSVTTSSTDTNSINNNNNNSDLDNMKSSRSTILPNSYRTAQIPNSVSAYNFTHYQQHPQRIVETFNMVDPYYVSRTGSHMTNSPSQHRMSGSTSSSQTSSGFESMKNGSHSLSNAGVHQTRNFNSPSRSSIHSNDDGSSSLGSLEKLDEINGGGSLIANAPSSSSSAFYSAHNNSNNNNVRINFSQMALNGVSEEDSVSIWLHSLRYEEYLALFVNAGYDMQTIVKMTPEDLTAIGITKPGHRKRLTSEIRKLNIVDSWPCRKPVLVREWLTALSMSQYVPWFNAQGYANMEQIMQLTWEDFEDIGVKKLGHLKKLICALKKLKDNQHQQQQQQLENGCQSRFVGNNADAHSQMLLINVPSTPRRTRTPENQPFSHHSPQLRSSSSMSTFFQSNKYQDVVQPSSWIRKVDSGAPSPLARTAGLNSPLTARSSPNRFAQENVIYENDNYNYTCHSDRGGAGCAPSFALWRRCTGGSSTPTRRFSGTTEGIKYNHGYLNNEAILHQPDRPRVIVKPYPVENDAVMSRSTSSLENGNTNSVQCRSYYNEQQQQQQQQPPPKPKLLMSGKKQSKQQVAADVAYLLVQQEQRIANDAVYSYCDTPSEYMKARARLAEPSSQIPSTVGSHGNGYQENFQYYKPKSLNQQMKLNEQYLQPINGAGGSVPNDCCYMSSSVFQLSPQPLIDECTNIELSPSNSVDDFPPPLRPISCEEQIRNLCYLQQPSDDSGETSAPSTIEDYTLKIIKPLNVVNPDKHVTFAVCQSPRRNENAVTTNGVSFDGNCAANSLPFANENFGTIRSKPSHIDSRCHTAVPDMFKESSFTSGDKKQPDVLEDIGDMLQDLTDQLDALLAQRSALQHLRQQTQP